MPLPSTIELCKISLFDSNEELIEKNVPEQVRAKILRVRSGYNYLLSNPTKKDKEIIGRLQKEFNIQKTAAYDDLKIIKTIIGELTKSTKDFHRFRFNSMIIDAYNTAKNRRNTRSMVAAADKYAKYNALDQADDLSIDWEIIPIQPFVPTSDPSVLGIKPIPNIDKKIALLQKKYWNEDVEDVKYDEIDNNLGSFKIKGDE